MNPSFWGSNAWDFLHQLPWNYTKEVLSPQDSIELITMLHILLKILSCTQCSESALQIERQNMLLEALFLNLPQIDGSNKKVVTRAKVTQWIYGFHNAVNFKLGRSAFGTSWEDSVIERPKWERHMFNFFDSVIWTWPKEPNFKNRVDYDYFFSILVPNCLKYTTIGKFYQNFLEKNSFTEILGDRQAMFKWIYDMRKEANRLCGSTWSYKDTCTFMEAVQSHSDCLGKEGKKKSETCV